MRYKILIISFLAFLPIWWGVNALSSNMEDFLFVREITQNPNILNARANYSISQLTLSKVITEKNLKEKLESLDIDADSIIIVDSGKVIFEKDSFQTRPIASLTKLMTALVIFDLDETYNLSDVIKVNKKSIEQDGDSSLRIGDSVSIKDLLRIMLVESSNDAAYAITQPIGQEAFVDIMNAKTKELGLNNTYFINSTGLDPDDPLRARNISNASDLSKLTEYILNNHVQILEITTDTSGNTNDLLEEYPEIVGGKTGWTPLAGGCLIVITQKPEGGHYISIILGAKDRFAEMRKILDTLR